MQPFVITHLHKLGLCLKSRQFSKTWWSWKCIQGFSEVVELALATRKGRNFAAGSEQCHHSFPHGLVRYSHVNIVILMTIVRSCSLHPNKPSTRRSPSYPHAHCQRQTLGSAPGAKALGDAASGKTRRTFGFKELLPLAALRPSQASAEQQNTSAR